MASRNNLTPTLMDTINDKFIGIQTALQEALQFQGKGYFQKAKQRISYAIEIAEKGRELSKHG